MPSIEFMNGRHHRLLGEFDEKEIVPNLGLPLLRVAVDCLEAAAGGPAAAGERAWTADRLEEVLSVEHDPLRDEANLGADGFREALVRACSRKSRDRISCSARRWKWMAARHRRPLSSGEMARTFGMAGFPTAAVFARRNTAGSHRRHSFAGWPGDSCVGGRRTSGRIAGDD